MADLSKITCPDGTTVDILSKTTRGIVRGVMNNSSSTSTSFVISAPGIDSLYDGATFICKNTKVASAAGCVMDVNGLGAKDMWCSQSNTAVTTHWTKNYTYIWVYDATNERWEFYQGRDTDNNDTYTVTNYYSHPVAGGNGLKKYSLFARLADGSYSSLFTNDGGTGSKTFDTTTEFDLSKVFYTNVSEDIAAGSVMTNDNVWRMACINIDMRYNFTGVTTSASTSSLHANLPVYLVVTETSHGYFKLVSPYITQDPTSVSTDYLYVLIGYMRNSYYMDFHVHSNIYILTAHVIDDNPPVYEYLPYVNFKIKRAESNISTLTTQVNNKMDKVNPTGSGHLALNQATGSTVGDYSVTEGFMCSAEGLYSHAEGLYTIAYADTQHVSGKFNEIDTGLQYAEIIGNGTDVNARSNARTLDWDGNESISGTHSCYDTSYINNLTINAKSSTNGVSQTGEYISNIFVEKNGYQIGRVGVDAVDTGRIGVNISSTNYNSSGTEMVSNSLILNSYKDGTASVAISHPDKWRDSLGLTNNQVANDGYVLKTGNIYCTSPATDISSIANNTNTATGTLKFPAGLYILIYYCRFGYASGSGYRYISINNSNAAGSYGILNQASMAGFSGTDAHMQLVSFLKFSSETSIYLRAYQNSGSTLSLAPRYNVIKLY